MKKLKQVLQSKYLFKILCVLSILFSIIKNIYLDTKSYYSLDKTEITGKVLNYQIDGNKLKLILKGKEKIIIYYYFKTKEEKNNYEKKIELGLVLEVRGTFTKHQKNTIPNEFNYQRYLKYQNINFSMNASKINVLEKNTSVFYYLKNKLVKRINNIDSSGYLHTFILGDKSFINDDSIDSYQDNGISHLFSISGMHVGLIASLILFFLNKISYNNLYKYSIVTLFLIFYLFLTGVAASTLRTVIMFILFGINKILNLNIKKIDLMLIVLIISILINNYIIFDIGFQFSYIISFSLIIYQKKISKINKKWKQNLIISVISFLVSFPICIYYYYSVNLLSIFLNLLMIPFVSIIIFPLTLITLVFPIIYPVYCIFICILEKINLLISNIDIFKITLSKPSILIIFIYYICIFLIFKNKKYFIIFVFVLIIHKYYLYFDKSFLITYLNVGQGDSILVKLAGNRGNILIDTGGKIKQIDEEWKKSKSNYSIAQNKLIPYFKSLGMIKINYFIITHGDYDHMGEAINLVENFKVEKVIFNCGESNELEQELIKVLDKKKIPYYSCIKELNIDNNKLFFLNNKDYGNENDNSSVIYTELNNRKFLFMGDAGVEVEEDLIKKYNLQDIDVLKVGHHGSKTSSSKIFIDEINLKYSIISVGKNNRYGHPNKEVLNNLEGSKIYRTDQDGSIMFKIKNNKLEIKTCAP